MNPTPFTPRPATADDASIPAATSIQVGFDTYCQAGVRAAGADYVLATFTALRIRHASRERLGADHRRRTARPSRGLRFAQAGGRITGGGRAEPRGGDAVRGAALCGAGRGRSSISGSLGRRLIVGWASTPAVAQGRGQRGAPNANVLPTNLIMMKGLDVLGCPMVIATVNDPTIRPPRFAQIMQWAADGRITPHVSHVYPLSEFKTAMRAKWNGEVSGGCVLHP